MHADELGPASPLRRELHRRELVSPHAAGTNVAYFPAFDQVMQSLHGLFDKGGLVEAVDLEEVDVGCIQPSQRRLDGVENALT